MFHDGFTGRAEGAGRAALDAQVRELDGLGRKTVQSPHHSPPAKKPCQVTRPPGCSAEKFREARFSKEHPGGPLCQRM